MTKKFTETKKSDARASSPFDLRAEMRHFTQNSRQTRRTTMECELATQALTQHKSHVLRTVSTAHAYNKLRVVCARALGKGE